MNASKLFLQMLTHSNHNLDDLIMNEQASLTTADANKKTAASRNS